MLTLGFLAQAANRSHLPNVLPQKHSSGKLW